MKVFSATDIGQKRTMNQDFVFASDTPVGPLPNLLIVADGMGGHQAGDMASRYAAEVIDSRAFSEFCGVTSSNQVPNGDTIGRFRNILIQNRLQEKLFADIVSRLKARGLMLMKGTIVDSTLIAVPSSTK